MTQNLISELCVRDEDRDSITNKEKVVALVIVMLYIPLMFTTIKNLIRFYDKERQKVYSFMPTINILLFTCIYTRIAVYLDGATILKHVFSSNEDNSTGYLYQNTSILWIL